MLVNIEFLTLQAFASKCDFEISFPSLATFDDPLDSGLILSSGRNKIFVIVGPHNGGDVL